jgi:hypothetical protein
MDLSRVSRSELIAIGGGLLLAIGLFLNWYHLQNGNAAIGTTHGPATLSGWDVHTVLRFLLLAGAAAPLILAWIIARGHALSWPRGEVTAVVAITAFGLLLYNAVITRPGNPRSLISLQYGYFIAIVGTLLMLVGAAARTSETGRKRKPPGTL